MWHQIPSTNLQRTWCTSHSRGNKIQDSKSLRCNKYMLGGTPSKGTPIQDWKWNTRKGFSEAGERVKGIQTVGGLSKEEARRSVLCFYEKYLVRLLFGNHKIFRLLCFTSYNSFPASARFFMVLVALLITIQKPYLMTWFSLLSCCVWWLTDVLGFRTQLKRYSINNNQPLLMFTIKHPYAKINTLDSCFMKGCR